MMKTSKHLILLVAVCFTLALTAISANAQAASLAGSWEGIVTAGNLKMTLNLSNSTEGELKGKLDVPAAGAMNLPVDHLVYADRILSFEENIGAPFRYEGVVSRDLTESIGFLFQGPNIVPLNFVRTNAKPDLKASRPAILSSHDRKIDLQPCNEEGMTKDALCGQYQVFEDRARRSGRKIKLNLLVLPALVDKPEPDPIFYLVGGPGGAATQSASTWIMTRMHRNRDVVLVDQRGTGKSNPLQCYYRGDPNDMRGYFVEGLTIDLLSRCRADLEKNADLRLYTTTIAMADLDDVRNALGYNKINVYGGSYGSTTALSYLNFYPQHVRTVTITGVAPPNDPLLISFAKGVEHALNRLFDDCAADEKCRTTFPKLRQDWSTVLANLDKGPVTFEALNKFTNQKQEVTMTRAGFQELVRLVLYNPAVMSVMPLMIHEMSQGDYSHFSYYAFQLQHGIDVSLARGMQLSVLCAEDMPFIKESDIDTDSAGTFYGGTRVHLFIKLCQQWPRGEAPTKFRRTIKSDIPVLMLSGELDPVTPPIFSTPLLRSLSNGRQIIMHNATHYAYECTEKLARDFIDQGSAKNLDASCVDEIKRLPFVTSMPPLSMPK